MYEFIVKLHLCAGSFSLVFFWPAFFSRKISHIHKRWGRLCVFLFLLTSLTAYILCYLILVDKAVEIGSEKMIVVKLDILTSTLVWVPLFHGLWALKGKEEKLIHYALPLSLLAVSLLIMLHGISSKITLLTYFPLLGFYFAWKQVLYIRKKKKERGEALIEHLYGVLVSYTALFTAFLMTTLLRFFHLSNLPFLLLITPPLSSLLIIYPWLKRNILRSNLP